MTDKCPSILSTGSSVGENCIGNEELERQVSSFDALRAGMSLPEWIEKHFGIKSRAIASRSSSEMANEAAALALQRSGLSVNDLDFLILNTVSGDHRQPTTATEVQGLLGMRKASFAVEINMPCSGSIYGLVMAKSMIVSGMAKCGLVIGVDKMSAFIDPKDFIMAGMFGDGAGAAVVGKGDGPVIVDQVLYSKADKERALFIQSGGSFEPTSAANLERGDHWLKMKGPETSAFIRSAITQVTQELLARNGLKPDQLAKVIPHQASKHLVTEAFMQLGFKPEQLHFTMERYGNTSAGSLLITLHDHLGSRPVSNGPVLLVGMGGGLNWGGILLDSSY